MNEWIKLFFICIQLPGHFDGACANYKWRDHVNRCSVQDDQEDESDDDYCLKRDLEVGLVGGGGWRI